ncbi:MAG: 4-(cytidine 5'-diphospho)-2-C-methyl-D-erythritol kinase [Magnetococcales bacterium]|nr:4-(cytidine 5'-diphospho)-2-C-methyl-D-erythritol kinase [Magnetococcales bacterium]
MTRRFLAPAKVNMALRIVGRRADGFHLLWTVMTFFPLYDILEITCPADGLQLTCEPPVTPEPEKNLVWQAAQRLQAESGTRQGAHLHLTKHIPHGAGLGGGSSDAATTLLALNRLWGLHWPVSRLLPIGAQLGADIPIFLGGEAALAEGIGERLTPLPHLAEAELVVVNPGIILPTGQVFAQWHAQASSPTALADCLLPTSATESVLPLLGNDLEATATRMAPVIGLIVHALQQQGAQATVMSGSGSSVVGVFAERRDAEAAAFALRHTHRTWQIYPGRTFNKHPFANE